MSFLIFAAASAVSIKQVKDLQDGWHGQALLVHGGQQGKPRTNLFVRATQKGYFLI